MSCLLLLWLGPRAHTLPGRRGCSLQQHPRHFVYQRSNRFTGREFRDCPCLLSGLGAVARGFCGVAMGARGSRVQVAAPAPADDLGRGAGDLERERAEVRGLDWRKRWPPCAASWGDCGRCRRRLVSPYHSAPCAVLHSTLILQCARDKHKRWHSSSPPLLVFLLLYSVSSPSSSPLLSH